MLDLQQLMKNMFSVAATGWRLCEQWSGAEIQAPMAEVTSLTVATHPT